MKPHITFSYKRLFLKPYLYLSLFLLAALLTALGFYPESAQYLTVTGNNQQVYLSSCPKLSPVEPPDQQGEKQLSVPFTLFNWNIYKQQKEQWQEELQQWTATADLLTLQEVKYSPEFSNFSKVNKLFSFQNYAFKYQSFVYGVNTLSKYHSSFVCGTRYTEPWIRVAKTALASIYPIANSSSSLLVINLHGVNFTFTAQPLIKQIQPFLKLINAHKGPVIFSGDFNTWSSSRLEAVEDSLQQAGFSEALFDNDQRITLFGKPLDHLYFRGLKVIKTESLATEASDHTPQLVTFALE